jgi:hypothetical protein
MDHLWMKKERTRLTVGGDQIEYPGDKSVRTAGLSTAKKSDQQCYFHLGRQIPCD